MSGDPRLPDAFARASELTGAEREACLAELRREDAALAREVEELLAAASQGERRFASPALDRLTPAGGFPALLPERIGPYRILREIGRGGMGRVFLAEQREEEFHRQVALKVIARPGFADEHIRRFRDEVRILATLEHPGIARFLDGGRAADGTWYLAMEYVEGEDLVSYARTHALDLRQRVELFLQVAAAADFAHRRLVVHRDLKPANVLVGADGRARLLDFGVSKILDPEAGEDATRTELRAFTPAYASPEQLRGERATVATDVYSLGVMLYELLAGRRPFERRGPGGLDLAGLDRDPEPPSTAIRQAASPGAREPADTTATVVRWRDLAGDLDAITLKALRAEPERRYGSAAALGDDLRRWLEGRPVEARRGGRRYRLAKFVRRHRAPVASAALAVVALVGATLFSQAQARVAARERDRALEDLRRAEITDDFSAFLLAEIPTGKPFSQRDLLAHGEQIIERRFAEDPGLRTHMTLILAERYDEAFEREGFERASERAFMASRGLADVRLRALAECRMARVLNHRGEAERADGLLAEALAALAQERGSAKEEAYCRHAEAEIAFRRGDIPRALAAAEQALGIERARRGPPGSTLQILSSLSFLYNEAERYLESDRVYEELFALFEAQGRERTRGAAICRDNWATSLLFAGQIARSVVQSEQSVGLYREIEAERGPPANALTTYGIVLSLVGRDEEALAALDEAIASARAGNSGSWLVRALASAVTANARAGRIEAAEARLAEFEASVGGQASPSPARGAQLERLRAAVALERGEPDLAATAARAGLERLEAAGRPASELLPPLLVLARAENQRGAFGAALAAAERALTIARAGLGGYPHSRDVGLAITELGLAHLGRGETAEGRASLRAAVSELRESVGSGAPETRRAEESLAGVGS